MNMQMSRQGNNCILSAFTFGSRDINSRSIYRWSGNSGGRLGEGGAGGEEIDESEWNFPGEGGLGVRRFNRALIMKVEG